MNKNIFTKRNILISSVALILIFVSWERFKTPPTVANWRDELSIQATAEFKDNLVTIKNVRNFRYSDTEENNQASYYDQTYDLNKISKVWYIVEPFKGRNYAAHTFLSFEFTDGKYVTISIEARKTKGQKYSLIMGMLRTYPLMYIIADERDTLIVRTNIRKDEVYLYPTTATPGQAKLLFVDMLKRTNELAAKPEWYNTFTANCTSSIAYHINKIWPDRLPSFMWQEWVTGYADGVAFDQGFIDTNLSLEKARQKYYITKVSQKIGDVSDYSKIIRQFDK